MKRFLLAGVINVIAIIWFVVVLRIYAGISQQAVHLRISSDSGDMISLIFIGYLISVNYLYNRYRLKKGL